ncbi:endopeptidase La [Euzebya tangerina]|uniref:endopeptidase La n=1 Tax=Euzebya tangerina TaxID=591198 RepID=UPI000E30D52A|nr:endopeptidase La [Euzebya tangerina]
MADQSSSTTAPDPAADSPATLPLLPLPGGVVVPGMVVTIAIESSDARAAIDAAAESRDRVVLVPKVTDEDGKARFATVGTIASIEQHDRLRGGRRGILVRGLSRGLIGVGAAGAAGATLVEVTPVADRLTGDISGLEQDYRAVVDGILEHRGGQSVSAALQEISDPGQLADTAVYSPDLEAAQKVQILEALDVRERLELALGWARETLAELNVRSKIRDDVNESVENRQREFILREQMKAIQSELREISGTEDGEDGDSIAAYRARAERLPLPEAVRTFVGKEIDRLERVGEQSPEQSWIRTWLDRVFEMPWGTTSQDTLDLIAARTILDEDHTGLDEVKERLIEQLAVRKLRVERGLDDSSDATEMHEGQDGETILSTADLSTLSTADLSTAEPGPTDDRTDDGTDASPADTTTDTTAEATTDEATTDTASPGTPDADTPDADTPDNAPARTTSTRRGQGAILALVGPPGVGKTSLGESIARALNRSFVRVALGGVRDEAEIRGHRRTYVGAQPGRIVRAMTEAGTMNPVMLLDEIDKVGGDYRGDPRAALLEVLDPAQNHTFRDHYLEIDLDLSDVLFIATANVLETIPGPLLDRLEVVQLDGYTDAEKVAIARDHLIGRQLGGAGLSADEVQISDEILRKVVEGWTREAGVRQLERQLAKIARKAAVEIARGSQTPIQITDPADLLGRQRVFKEDAMARVDVPGVATGLAVTGVGGDVLFVETAQTGSSDGDGGLKLTGQLGDVMQESASIALSFLRSHADELADGGLVLDRDALTGGRFHVHFPAGGIPKDGPSAGVTMTTAFASLMTGQRVKKGVGMTGEVTLQGKVLPIGGVKQKVLAAHRAGLDTVLLPKRNEADLDEVPQEIRDELTIHLVDDVREVLELALADAA